MADQDQSEPFSDLPPVKPLSITQRRLIMASTIIENEDPSSILYQHTILCQTGLPYRDPGADVGTPEPQCAPENHCRRSDASRKA